MDDNKDDRNELVVDIDLMDNKYYYCDSYPMYMHILYVCLFQPIDRISPMEDYLFFEANTKIQNISPLT